MSRMFLPLTSQGRPLALSEYNDDVISFFHYFLIDDMLFDAILMAGHAIQPL